MAVMRSGERLDGVDDNESYDNARSSGNKSNWTDGVFVWSLSKLRPGIREKHFYDAVTTDDSTRHVTRDAEIRKYLEQVIRSFRKKREDGANGGGALDGGASREWFSLHNQGMVTDHEAMSKVDLPYLVVEASMNMSRYRYDITAHVDNVTDNVNVFSNEQGQPPKGRSYIIESILVDHVLRCTGEDIKIVVADNASVE